MGLFDGLPVSPNKADLREELSRIDESWAAARFDSLPHVVHILTSKDREAEVQFLKEQSDVVEEVVDEVVHAYHSGFNKAIQNYSQIRKDVLEGGGGGASPWSEGKEMLQEPTMAVGGLSTVGGIEYEAKITPIVVISCIMAATGGLMFGYDIGISGGCDTFGASYTTRSLGRRLTMLIAGIFFIIGTILNAAAINFLMLVLGRLMLGCSVGFANQVNPEASTPIYSLRGLDNFKFFSLSFYWYW
ncbi:hypothetical protein CsatA_020238 [Cannabis sativa]